MKDTFCTSLKSNEITPQAQEDDYYITKKDSADMLKGFVNTDLNARRWED